MIKSRRFLGNAVTLQPFYTAEDWRRSYPLRELHHRSLYRGKYRPGGANRNCGDRGISPKSVARRQAQS